MGCSQSHPINSLQSTNILKTRYPKKPHSISRKTIHAYFSLTIEIMAWIEVHWLQTTKVKQKIEGRNKRKERCLSSILPPGPIYSAVFFAVTPRVQKQRLEPSHLWNRIVFHLLSCLNILVTRHSSVLKCASPLYTERWWVISRGTFWVSNEMSRNFISFSDSLFLLCLKLEKILSLNHSMDFIFDFNK